MCLTLRCAFAVAFTVAGVVVVVVVVVVAVNDEGVVVVDQQVILKANLFKSVEEVEMMNY